MDELVDEFVAGNGFIPGISVDEPEQIDPNDPCKGAVPRLHSHFFTEDGEFGSRDWKGEDVDVGRYRVMGDKLVISKEFPDVTFRFRIEGDTITFDPLNIPAGCTSFECGWSIAVAYPGETLKRVGSSVARVEALARCSRSVFRCARRSPSLAPHEEGRGAGRKGDLGLPCPRKAPWNC